MGGRSQDWVTEGHWSRLLGGFGLQAGCENMGKHDKGSSKQEGRQPILALSVGFKSPTES